MADPNLGQRVATVYEKVFPKKPTDNVIKSLATFRGLGPNGFKQSASGGRVFECPIEYGENTTNAMIAETGTVDTTRIDVFDASRWDQKIGAGTVSFSVQEMLQVQGTDDRKYDLIAAKIENVRKSHFALLNRQSWGTAPGTNDLTSIYSIVVQTPTSGVVGGIDSSLYSFWRNQASDATKTTTKYDNLQSTFRTVWNNCSLGGINMTPTCIISDMATFAGFEGTLTSVLRFTTDDRQAKGDPGFATQAISYKGTPYFFDEDAPANSAYFLNSDVLKFEYLEGGWATLGDEIEAVNSLTKLRKIFTIGNYICSARRHLGILYNAGS
jgi:hypothetical protein